MSLEDDLAKIHKAAVRDSLDAYDRWWASLTTEEQRAKTAEELAFLRRWDAMSADQKSEHLRRQLTGQL